VKSSSVVYPLRTELITLGSAYSETAVVTSCRRQSQYVNSVSSSSYTAPTALGMRLNKLGITFVFNVFKRFFCFFLNVFLHPWFETVEPPLTSASNAIGRDEKPRLIATDCYIVTNSGTLCRMHVKRRCERQTDRRRDGRTPTDIDVLNTCSYTVMRGRINTGCI